MQTLETAEITNTNRDDAEVFFIILIRIFWYLENVVQFEGGADCWRAKHWEQHQGAAGDRSIISPSRTGLTDAKVEVIVIDDDEVVVIDTDEVIVIDEEEELVIIEREEASNVSINLFNSFQP